MKEWLKPEITESEAGMEVTSYLPAELDRAKSAHRSSKFSLKMAVPTKVGIAIFACGAAPRPSQLSFPSRPASG